jgi:hypothetical protein
MANAGSTKNDRSEKMSRDILSPLVLFPLPAFCDAALNMVFISGPF